MKPIAIISLGVCLSASAFAQSVTLSQLFAFTCQPTTPWFCADGAKPVALIQAADGSFYGATETSYAQPQQHGTPYGRHHFQSHTYRPADLALHVSTESEDRVFRSRRDP